MKIIRKRILPVFLAAWILLGNAALPVQASNPGGVTYLNTHENTGNQREDILAIALSQLGYMEKYENDTKYGDWYGLPGQPWCAMFISWCAREAEISTDILKRCAWAHPNSFKIPYYSGETYTPQPGDLFFDKNFEHVGLVWYVEGEFFYCVEGNAKYHDYAVPGDPDEDSYHVMTNKRLTRDYYFGVPAYEGCDKDHDYTRGVEQAHPHRTYYRCGTCGDQYYTGYTECDAGCGECLTCGCSSAVSGYYLVTGSSKAVRIRTGHSTGTSAEGYATVGEAVYVHGMDTKNGWAYIEYDGLRGHIQTKYLSKYCDVPKSPQVTAAADYLVTDPVSVQWNMPANTEQFRLKVYRDGALYLEQTMDLNTSWDPGNLPAGSYEVRVLACNRSGPSDAGVLAFTVRDTCTLTYDANGGSGGPQSQTMGAGDAAVLDGETPVREGYTFLGWTGETEGRFAAYSAGDTLPVWNDMTLYAVWKAQDAQMESVSLERLPTRTVFVPGEPLDTTGLALRVTYSDGTGHIVKEGYTAQDPAPDTQGPRSVTVSYGGLTVQFEIRRLPGIPGDTDRNNVVDRDDVMHLLWHISFPDTFAVQVPVDYNGDGQVDRDDVMQLLWHISFPDQFPLEVQWPQTEPETEEGV